MVEHQFGGAWTDRKVELIRRYLDSYTTALKHTRFDLIYVDAFAGTGYRSAKGRAPDPLLFTDIPAIADLSKGSARVALEIEDRPFDQYMFIEKNKSHHSALNLLRAEFPDRADRMNIVRGDANTRILEFCQTTNWNRTRAVMFLDPYGMQVEWGLIEAIADTRCIDLWYLFPVMAIVRMTPKSGRIIPAWEKRIDLVLGDKGWREVFYRNGLQTDLFPGMDRQPEKTTDADTVEGYLLERLRTVFAGVAPKTWRLISGGQCMFILAFASGNAKGKDIAIRIANHLINETAP